MGFGDIFKRSKPSDESIELPEEEEQTQKIMVRVENLTDSIDVERVERLMKDG